MPVLELSGTWKMVWWTKEDVASGACSDAPGPDPVGYISYGADGRVMVLVVSRTRPRPAGSAPTDAEKIALFDSMLSYTGRYMADSETVVHTVEASWNQLWTDTRQERLYTWDGDQLELRSPPSADPYTGAMVIHRIVFRKMPVGPAR